MSEPKQRPKALLVTRNLPPLRGGMERLVQHMAMSLAGSHDLVVVGPSGCSRFLPGGTLVFEVVDKPLWRFIAASATTIRGLGKMEGFELVVAGSGLTAPLAWWAAWRARACFAVYLHGLDIVAPSVIYQRIWLPFIRRANLILVNSQNTRRLAIERRVPSDVIKILHPGTDLPDAGGEKEASIRVRQELGDRPLMLSVGRFTPRKGLADFIRHGLPRILARHPRGRLLVIGADANDAVRPATDSELTRILRSARDAGVADAVVIVPPCDDRALSAAYRSSDVLVFPVLDVPGDVEGFGMVAVEAAAHGLPTVAFAVGGVPDAVRDGVNGYLVAPGDYHDFAERVSSLLDVRQGSHMRSTAKEMATEFSWENFDRKLQLAVMACSGRDG